MKFVDSNFFFENGKYYSEAIVEHKGSEYKGIVVCREEDVDTVSMYAGCRFAEAKAEIKALKAERQSKKIECEVCRNFVKSLTSMKNFDPESSTAKAVFRQLNIKIKEVNELTNEINLRLVGYQRMVGGRDITIAALTRKINKDKSV